MKVKYTWGTAGRSDEVTAIQYDAADGSGWRNLISNITYDIGGEVAGYSMNTSGSVVDLKYDRNGPTTYASPLNCSYSSLGVDDWSGRLTGMTVKRGATNLMTKRYSWIRDLMSKEDTCWMGATSPVVEAYGTYDNLGQLTYHSKSDSWGGAFRSGQLQYAFGADRVREATNSQSGAFWEHTYDSQGRETAQLPRNSMSGTVISSWEKRTFTYDSDGRVNSIRETPVPWAWGLIANGRAIDLTPNNGFGSVYSQIVVNGATYQYFYDSEARRRLKIYPAGLSDEFFYDGEHLLEDQGLRTSSSGSTTALMFEQYIWLGNMPVAVLRQRFSPTYVRDAANTDCTRNGEPGSCGLFFIVSDYLPKPVAMLNSNGQVAGIGEYDPFGRVNAVSVRVQAPAPVSGGAWPFGPYTATPGPTTLVTFTPPTPGGLAGRARFNYALVNAWIAGNNKTWIASGATCSTSVSPDYTGFVGSFGTPWATYATPTQYCLRWDAPALNGVSAGVVGSSYEYQNAESGVAPTWLPLRLPGQYADAESGLFENWNRFYDSGLGRYLASDPVLPSHHGHLSRYVYARNRPLVFVDPDGLREFNKAEAAAVEQAIQRIRMSDPTRANKLRLALREGNLEAFSKEEWMKRNGIKELSASDEKQLADANAVTVGNTISIIQYNSPDGLDSTLVHELYHRENPRFGDLDISDVLHEQADGPLDLLLGITNGGYEAEAIYRTRRQKVHDGCKSKPQKGCESFNAIPALPPAR